MEQVAEIQASPGSKFAKTPYEKRKPAYLLKIIIAGLLQNCF